MLDLKMLGYTVERLETNLSPVVKELEGEYQNSMKFNCYSHPASNDVYGSIRIELTMDVCLKDKIESNQDREPFVTLNGVFHVAFEASEKVTEEEFDRGLKSTGARIALPVIRGIIVGVTSIMGYPNVFSFPQIDPEVIHWEKDEL